MHGPWIERTVVGRGERRGVTGEVYKDRPAACYSFPGNLFSSLAEDILPWHYPSVLFFSVSRKDNSPSPTTYINVRSVYLSHPFPPFLVLILSLRGDTDNILGFFTGLHKRYIYPPCLSRFPIAPIWADGTARESKGMGRGNDE